MTTKSYECPLAPFSKHGIDSGHCSEMCGANIAVKARYAAAGIPQDYQGIYLDNSLAKDDQAEVYRALEAYVATFSKEDTRIKSVYLYSKSPGTGKTTSAIVLLNEYIRRRFLYYVKKGEQVPETLGLFWDVNDFQRTYNLASMASDQEELRTVKDDIERYSKVEMLVMDDVGVRGSTESFRSLVHSVVNYRITNNLPTVFTSNVLLEDLGTVFDDRLRDRISDQNVILAFKGESKRGRRNSK